MDYVLLHGEAEGFIQSLEKMPLRDIGSPSKKGKKSLDLLQIPTLVHALILTEVWKHKVFPIICRLQDFDPKSTFLLYTVIHHEATVINLLETIMYHKESSEAAGDCVLDLVDYCHRKLTLLAGRSVSDNNSTHDRIAHTQLGDVASLQDLQEQSDVLEFEISIKALSVLGYITDHIESLSLSVLSRMLCTHNTPCVLVQLVEKCPWKRGSFYSFLDLLDTDYTLHEYLFIPEGPLEKYIEGRWRRIQPEDQLKLSKHDGQLWMALLNLMLKPDCQRKYDFNSFNKSQLLKVRPSTPPFDGYSKCDEGQGDGSSVASSDRLRGGAGSILKGFMLSTDHSSLLSGFLTDVVIDQIPNLLDLKHFLSQLAFTDPAAPKKDLVLEQVPEIWNSFVRENEKKWKAIAKHQVTQFFHPSEGELREQACRLAQTYNLDLMENLIPEKPKCGACGRTGVKRCSRCQGEWYCNRECQVKHWPKHKPACNLMAEALEKLQQETKIGC
ncbi:hypothetical protein DNTS_032480 [Danionella cerebrum]|uniref:Zinc finger MYND domain-containing protein 10 n=1 Tax=Danionella cerebrum TaxID=2873325 RepID=A0A553QYZ4_9TELE|nr:hypothetical protein DNTS_032480 [Danionella translucida]